MSAYVTIHGNLAKPPEFKTIGSGTEIAEFSVAVNHYKGRDKEPTTSWYRVSVFGKQSEWVRDWQKGDRVIVNGELEMREWSGQDGAKRTSADVKANGLENISKITRGKSTDAPAYGASAPRAAKKDDENDSLPF